MACGWVIREDGGQGKIIDMATEQLGHGTNNIAEYTALIRGLAAADRHGVTSLKVYGDSNIVIFRMAHPKSKPTKNGQHLIPLIAEARRLAARFDSCTFTWIPRGQNTEADSLSTAGDEEAQERAAEAATAALMGDPCEFLKA